MAISSTRLRFSPLVEIVAREASHLTFGVARKRTFRVEVARGNLTRALDILNSTGATEDELLALAARDGGLAGASSMAYLVGCFTQLQLLVYLWSIDETDHACIVPCTPVFRLAGSSCAGDESAVLSRFAYLRRIGDQLTLESPASQCRIELLTPDSAAWLHSLSTKGRMPCGAPLQFADLLRCTGFLESDEGGKLLPQSFWEFHDRLFHCYTRGLLSRSTFRFAGTAESAPPAVKGPMSVTRICLPIPDLAALKQQSDDLLSVMERRQSNHGHYGTTPPLTQLGEFLFRVARVKRLASGMHQEVVFRPFPSAGAIHEIDFYIAIVSPEAGLSGLFHYHGVEHALYRLPATHDAVCALLKEACPNFAVPCLVILSSRHARIAWKYEGIAYRLTLMNAGSVIQSMYLVATDMGLACCALGTGNTESFARASGLDTFDEPSIAEFILAQSL